MAAHTCFLSSDNLFFAVLMLCSKNEYVRVNFGQQPFKFDLEVSRGGGQGERRAAYVRRCYVKHKYISIVHVLSNCVYVHASPFRMCPCCRHCVCFGSPPCCQTVCLLLCCCSCRRSSLRSVSSSTQQCSGEVTGSSCRQHVTASPSSSFPHCCASNCALLWSQRVLNNMCYLQMLPEQPLVWVTRGTCRPDRLLLPCPVAATVTG